MTRTGDTPDTDDMVTTVVVPAERFRSGARGSDEVERMLVTRAIVDGIGGFARDSSRSELVNWGAGPASSLVEPDAIERARTDGLGISGIFATTAPADLDVYRSLLHTPLSVPDVPAVGLAIVDFDRGDAATRYQEGWITVKARCPDGRESWFVVSMPVTSLSACYAGVAFGFPKYVADEMTVTPTLAEARYGGEVRFALELTPGPLDDEAALRAQGIGAVENALTVHPTPDGGCLLNWFQRGRDGRRGFAGEVFDWVPGTVRACFDRRDPWAALVADGTTMAGVHQRVFETGASDLVCEKVGVDR